MATAKGASRQHTKSIGMLTTCLLQLLHALLSQAEHLERHKMAGLEAMLPEQGYPVQPLLLSACILVLGPEAYQLVHLDT